MPSQLGPSEVMRSEHITVVFCTTVSSSNQRAQGYKPQSILTREGGGDDMECRSQSFPGGRETSRKGHLNSCLGEMTDFYSGPSLGDRPGAALAFIAVEVTEEHALLCSQFRPPEQAPNPIALYNFSLEQIKNPHPDSFWLENKSRQRQSRWVG